MIWAWSLVPDLSAVIPGRCEASNPESRDSGSGPSDHPGMTTLREPQIFFAIATAVSAMRLEKPHSLSYQLITRTRLPFITLVWSMCSVEECGSWLKSIETLGAVV